MKKFHRNAVVVLLQAVIGYNCCMHTRKGYQSVCCCLINWCILMYICEYIGMLWVCVSAYYLLHFVKNNSNVAGKVQCAEREMR